MVGVGWGPRQVKSMRWAALLAALELCLQLKPGLKIHLPLERVHFNIWFSF